MSASPPAFDIAQLIEQWGSPLDEIYRTILEIYRDEAGTLCADARAALNEGRNDTLARVAHTMAGASANVGAAHLASCARAVEEAVRSGQTDRLEGLVSQVEAAWEAVQAEIALGGPRADG